MPGLHAQLALEQAAQAREFQLRIDAFLGRIGQRRQTIPGSTQATQALENVLMFQMNGRDAAARDRPPVRAGMMPIMAFMTIKTDSTTVAARPANNPFPMFDICNLLEAKSARVEANAAHKHNRRGAAEFLTPGGARNES